MCSNHYSWNKTFCNWNSVYEKYSCQYTFALLITHAYEWTILTHPQKHAECDDNKNQVEYLLFIFKIHLTCIRHGRELLPSKYAILLSVSLEFGKRYQWNIGTVYIISIKKNDFILMTYKRLFMKAFSSTCFHFLGFTTDANNMSLFYLYCLYKNVLEKMCSLWERMWRMKIWFILKIPNGNVNFTYDVLCLLGCFVFVDSLLQYVVAFERGF